jgi:hypothetical protein
MYTVLLTSYYSADISEQGPGVCEAGSKPPARLNTMARWIPFIKTEILQKGQRPGSIKYLCEW